VFFDNSSQIDCNYINDRGIKKKMKSISFEYDRKNKYMGEKSERRPRI
jgi:hypothetical protein